MIFAVGTEQQNACMHASHIICNNLPTIALQPASAPAAPNYQSSEMRRAVEQFQANYSIIHVMQADPGPSYKKMTLTLLQKHRCHFSKKVNNTESLNN